MFCGEVCDRRISSHFLNLRKMKYGRCIALCLCGLVAQFVAQAQQDMRSTYCYSDTQVFGEYPAYLLAKFKNEGVKIVKEPGDDEIMKKYPVDFVSFSYYSSSCVAKDDQGLCCGQAQVTTWR